MRFRRNKQPTQHSSVPSSSTELPAADPVAPTAEVWAHLEVQTQRIADRWNALTPDEQDDIRAAYAEQKQFMDERGITDFRACTRTFNTSEQPSPFDAAGIRARTEMLRSVLAATRPGVVDTR